MWKIDYKTDGIVIDNAANTFLLSIAVNGGIYLAMLTLIN